MSALLATLLLLAAPERLDGLPPLRTSPPAPRLEPTAPTVQPKGRACRITKHVFRGGRLGVLWQAECFGAQAWTFGLFDGVAVVPLLSQQGLQSSLAFDDAKAEEFDRYGAPPAWVPPRAVQQAKTPRDGAPPGFVELGVDPRDGSVLGHSYERGFVRLRGDFSVTPLFETPVPREVQSPRMALFFDADRTVKAPGLVYAVDPWRRGELKLRSPLGVEEALLALTPREYRGSFRVEALEALRVGSEARPIVTALVDGAHLLFTPAAKGGWSARALQGAPAMPLRPQPGLPPCSEDERTEATEQHFAPKLFEYRGRAYLAYVMEETETKLRFGPVPRDGATPAKDRLTCDWVVDARAAQRSLVIAQVQPDGSVVERLKLALQQQGYGSVLVLRVDAEEEQLHLLTGSPGLVSYAVLALPAALR